MMYYIFTLKFLTPVHFGDTANGGSLDKFSLQCSADTLFAALCNEAANKGSDAVATLVKKTAEGKCTSCAGNKTAGTHKKTGNKITESGAAETGCGKHRDSGGRKGADRRETGTAGKRSCSPSGE